jgi:tetratricopeptide (TPR) repeat protein
MKFAALLVFATSGLFGQQLSPFEVHLASGKAAMQQSRYSEADRWLRAAIDDASPIPAKAAEALETLCDLDLLIGKYDEAVELEEKAVAALDAAGSPDLSLHLTRLAGAYRADSQTPKAEPVLEKALALDIGSLGPDDARVATDYDSLGSALMEMRRYSEARPAYQKALDARVRRLGEVNLDIANSYVNLAILEERDSQPKAARVDLEKALEVSEKKLGDESYSLTGILDRLGLLIRKMKNYGEAEPILQRSLAIREKTLGARHSDVATALDNLALTYFADQKYAEAEPLLVRSLQIWLATQGPYSPFSSQAMDNLGSVYSAQRRFDEAEPLFKRALGIREMATIESVTNLALIYQTKNDPKRADQYFQRSILLAEKGLGGDHPDELSQTLEDYQTFLEAAGRTAEAKKIATRLQQLKETAANVHKAEK